MPVLIVLLVLLILGELFTLLLQCRRGHSAWGLLRLFRYAHRGYHDKPRIPENSMAAFRRAIENGYGAELDVHLMKDGRLAVIHDASLKRTAGADVLVEDLTAEELKQYRLEGTDEQIPLLEEVLELCTLDERLIPCIDFGHLNARTLGGIRTKADYAAILDRMAEVLGDDRARQFHVHFSRIEYSAGGEKRHWTFADTQFGPEPQPLMELLAERKLAPVVICESAGTQAEDAQTMQQMYRAARNV